MLQDDCYCLIEENQEICNRLLTVMDFEEISREKEKLINLQHIQAQSVIQLNLQHIQAHPVNPERKRKRGSKTNLQQTQGSVKENL